MWNLRRNLSSEMDSTWSTKSPDFISNKSLVATCWWGASCTLCLAERQTDLWASCSVPCLSVSTTAGKPWFHLSTNTLEMRCPIRIIQFKCLIYIKWMQLRALGEKCCHKRWPPLCLGGTQFQLLFESVSPEMQLLFAQINAIIPYYKINFGLQNEQMLAHLESAWLLISTYLLSLCAGNSSPALFLSDLFIYSLTL